MLNDTRFDTSALRENLDLRAVNPRVLTANQQTLPLLAVQDASRLILVRIGKMRGKVLWILFKGLNRSQEHGLAIPESTERVLVIQCLEETKHLGSG